ncbi:hypothetical protein HPB52_024584 [Rhipicephalus sanguineus]|uniref:Uncharacterized protein n=1 Tax=Rhipicephalus sanguineus TaxID=34632 RepID=A0A9D4TE50_RHISA|nr:hypothetical protein HPB52_024584 [Rhipicephalus sanguineus]
MLPLRSSGGTGDEEMLQRLFLTTVIAESGAASTGARMHKECLAFRSRDAQANAVQEHGHECTLEALADGVDVAADNWRHEFDLLLPPLRTSCLQSCFEEFETALELNNICLQGFMFEVLEYDLSLTMTRAELSSLCSDEKLVEVRQRPTLYDQRLKSYRNKQLRNDA